MKKLEFIEDFEPKLFKSSHPLGYPVLVKDVDPNRKEGELGYFFGLGFSKELLENKHEYIAIKGHCSNYEVYLRKDHIADFKRSETPTVINDFVPLPLDVSTHEYGYYVYYRDEKDVTDFNVLITKDFPSNVEDYVCVQGCFYWNCYVLKSDVLDFIACLEQKEIVPVWS